MHVDPTEAMAVEESPGQDLPVRGDHHGVGTQPENRRDRIGDRIRSG